MQDRVIPGMRPALISVVVSLACRVVGLLAPIAHFREAPPAYPVAAMGQWREQDVSMLNVLCSTTELEEYGEILAIGDHVERRVRSRRAYCDIGLDDVEWAFDRYAGLTGGTAVGIVAGDIVALAAIFTRITWDTSGPVDGWIAQPDSAWLEPVATTADTRRPLERIEYRMSPPDGSGHSTTFGHVVRSENDEQLGGWRVTLKTETDVRIVVG